MSKSICETIRHKIHQLSEKTVTLGFDGFTDSIFKVVHSKTDNQDTDYFKSIGELGKYITEKGEKNFSLELEEMTTKIGGNMPIMANALAKFGTKQHCIGSLGYPLIHPVFQKLPSNCTLYSFADPGWAKALELNGNKIMFAEIGALNNIRWSSIRDIVGHQALIDLFKQSDLICLLNWSELDNSTEIWKGLLEEIFPLLPLDERKPVGFFDLADCSKRPASNILSAMELLRAFTQYCDVVLSLNMNEALLVNDVLSPENYKNGNIEIVGQTLYQKLGISSVIVHYAKEALCWDKNGFHKKESFYVASPILSTGTGDNFNAGFCAGLLMGLDTEACILIGHATANFYMRNGKSPNVDDIITVLSTENKMASVL